MTVNKYASILCPALKKALSGGQEFMKLDLANAYLQLPLEEKSRQYVTISTHKGLFKYNMLLGTLQSSPVNAKQVAEWTAKDLVLSKVKKWPNQGWTNTDDYGEELRPYRQRKEELSLQYGCILWGSRVVVPEQGRKLVIEELHAQHQGMSRVKSLR